MKYVVDKNSKQSAYMQLYKQLRSDIINGAYKYGDKLPSKRMLADETATSVITIEHSYSILCDEGYVQSNQRKGYFVIYRKTDLLPTAEAEERIPVQSQEYYPEEEQIPFSVLAKTMRNVISEYGEKLLLNSSKTGSIELRGAISAYLARSKGIQVSPSQIIIGSGVEYLYGMIVQFLGRDRLYAIESPSYDKIRHIYSSNGAKCEHLKLGKHGILTSELKNSNATILHVTPFKSYPSGITASASKRNEYISWAKERNGIIIEDDYDSEFTVSKKHEDTVFSLEPHNSVIYVNTFTRTIAHSMRIGYMVLPSELVTAFNEKMGFCSCTVPTFDQYVLAHLINHGDFERHINRVRRKRRQNLKP